MDNVQLITSRHSKRAEVKRQIITSLNNKEVVRGSKLPPLREMSNDFSVSVSTVRKALAELEQGGELEVRHGSGIYVSDKCWESVVETTILNPAAGKKTICIIDAFGKDDVGGHIQGNFIIADVINGVKRSCMKAQWGLKLLSFVINEGEQAILRKINQIKEGVALVVTGQHFLPMLENVEQMGVPFIVLGPAGMKTEKYEISLDMFEAGSIAGRHLVELGHENVLYIGNNPCVGKSQYQRYAGFCFAHKKAFPNGKILEIFLPDFTTNDVLKQVCCEAAHKSMDLIKSVTAILIPSELIAKFVVPYLLNQGIKIPQTVSLVTIDNSGLGEVFTPAWTSVDNGRIVAGTEIADTLISWDTNSNMPPVLNHLVQPKLVRRESAVLNERNL